MFPACAELDPTLAGLHVYRGTLHGELLAVLKISEAFPGAPAGAEIPNGVPFEAARRQG